MMNLELKCILLAVLARKCDIASYESVRTEKASYEVSENKNELVRAEEVSGWMVWDSNSLWDYIVGFIECSLKEGQHHIYLNCNRVYDVAFLKFYLEEYLS